MRSHGMTTLSYDRFSGHASSYDVVGLGYNYRLDDIRASLGLAQFQRLPANNEKRRNLWDQLVGRLNEVEGMEVPFGTAEECSGKWVSQPYIFPIVLTYDQDRENVRRLLAVACCPIRAASKRHLSRRARRVYRKDATPPS